jgi:hypothetical protein
MELEFERIDCPNCGMICNFPKNFIDMRRRDHKNFFCAAGHPICFPDPNNDTPENLKKRVKSLEAEVKQLKTEKVQLLHKLEQAGVS